MNPRKKVLFLVIIMISIVLITGAIFFSILYSTAVSVERQRLEETAKSQARLIEAIARFDKKYSNDYLYGPEKATLDQVRDAHSRYRGFGETGEFTLSHKKDGNIVFLLDHRHFDLNDPKPVPWESKLAEPMRLALSGKSGTVIGLDYRGVKVLAAHEPVSELGLGIVVKIDLSEIRRPFIKAAAASGLIAVVIIMIGVRLFFKITDPIIKKLADTVVKLEKALEEVKTLRGILPICSFCKKIQDDKGNWNQLEVYVKERSEADFTHGICPECVKKHYGDFFP